MGAIIVGVDASDEARAALHWAAEEARLRHERLTVVHVWQALDFVVPANALAVPEIDLRDDLERDAQHLLEAALEELDDIVATDDVSSRLMEGSVAGCLADAAAGADLLVVGSRGRGAVRGLLLGSVSQQCALHAPCPLVVVREHDASRGAGTIVVGVDVSPSSEAALEWGLCEAQRRDAEVLAVHAWSFPAAASIGYLPVQTVDMIRAAATSAIDEIVGRASSRHPGVTCRQLVTTGAPGQALVEAARGAALLVVGTRGRGGFAGLLLGSTSQHCAHHAPCPIVIVRRASQLSSEELRSTAQAVVGPGRAPGEGSRA